jgi:hypothetical protein
MKLTPSEEYIERLQLWDKKKSKWIPFKLWPIQKQWLTKLYAHKQIIALKKRQMGWSQLTGADSLLQCMQQRNFTTLCLSISADDARVFLDRIRDMYRRIITPEEFSIAIMAGHSHWEGIKLDTTYYELVLIKSATTIVRGLDGGDSMVFSNGSSLISLSAQKGRGRTADRVILDEMAFYDLRHAKIQCADVLKSIVPTVDRAGGQIIGISTANGLNEFYDMYESAKYNRSNFYSFFVSCWDDPDMTKEKRAELMRDFGKDYVLQEFPENDTEAFLGTGSPRFPYEHIVWYREHRLIQPIVSGDITFSYIKSKYNEQQYITRSVLVNMQGRYIFYQKKYINGQYAVVVDVAEGLEHGDNSVAKVFNLLTLEQVAEYVGKCEPAELGDIVTDMGLHWNNAHLVVECNNHGIATITQIKNRQYPDTLIFKSVYSAGRPDDKFNNPQKRYGWQTNVRTKPMIIDNLADMLQKKTIPGLTKHDLLELSKYVRDAKGRTNAERGKHDDRVMVLAIFYYVQQFLPRRTYDEKYGKCEHCQNFYRTEQVCMRTNMLKDKNDICSMIDQIDYDTVTDKSQLDIEVLVKGR